RRGRRGGRPAPDAGQGPRRGLRVVGHRGPVARCLRWCGGRSSARTRGGVRMSQGQQALEVIRSVIEESEIEHEAGAREGEIVLTLPGEKKLKTVVSLVVGEQALSVSAFVIRNADENHTEFYRYLLQRNLRLPLLA